MGILLPWIVGRQCIVRGTNGQSLAKYGASRAAVQCRPRAFAPKNKPITLFLPRLIRAAGPMVPTSSVLPSHVLLTSASLSSSNVWTILGASAGRSLRSPHRATFTMPEFEGFWQDAQQRAAVRAARERLPDLVRDLLARALGRDVSCARCNGFGWPCRSRAPPRRRARFHAPPQRETRAFVSTAKVPDGTRSR
jgi:hypothetical protein